MTLSDEEIQQFAAAAMRIDADAAVDRAKAYLYLAEAAMGDRQSAVPALAALSTAYSALAVHLPLAAIGRG